MKDDLRAAHRLLEATLSSLEEAILVVEQPSRRILACNAAFERASGRTADEIVGGRTGSRTVLTQHGYTVLEPGDGREAITVVERSNLPIDLVLTDVVMPNLSGPELGERMSALRPGAKVVYMSGYTDADGASSAIERGAEFIAKPFTPSALIAKLRAVLDG
jgi:DNA-binding NtrC family response regulator